MIINLSLELSINLQQLAQILNIKYVQSSRNVIWCSGFYIKLMKRRVEINVFDDNISEQYIFNDVLKPIFEMDKTVLVRIQKGLCVTQFMANDKLACM